MHRRDNRCEICNAPFNITADRASLKQMMRAFCCGRCCGMIVKHMLFSASLMPLAHVILQQVSECRQWHLIGRQLVVGTIEAYLRFFTCVQVLHCMDNLNQGSTEQLTVQEVFVASCALLTSSALFFHFFEFVTTRFLLIRNILRHWWMFGSTNDFGIVEVEDDSFDLFWDNQTASGQCLTKQASAGRPERQASNIWNAQIKQNTYIDGEIAYRKRLGRFN